MFAGRPGVGVGFTWPHGGPALTFLHPPWGQLGIASGWIWLLDVPVYQRAPRHEKRCHQRAKILTFASHHGPANSPPELF